MMWICSMLHSHNQMLPIELNGPPLPPPKKSRIFKLWVCQMFLLLMYMYIARPGLKWDILLICGLIGSSSFLVCLCVICCLFSQYMFCLCLCMFIALTLFLLCLCLSQLPFNCCSATWIWQILLNLMYSCECQFSCTVNVAQTIRTMSSLAESWYWSSEDSPEPLMLEPRLVFIIHAITDNPGIHMHAHSRICT